MSVRVDAMPADSFQSSDRQMQSGQRRCVADESGELPQAHKYR
jgi:hypothetical protein